MSSMRTPKTELYAPSTLIDGMVLSVLGVVCLACVLVLPNPSAARANKNLLADADVIEPVTVPAPPEQVTPPGPPIEPDAGTQIGPPTPPTPDIKPPPEIDIPSIKPDTEPPGLRAITPRALAPLTRQQAARSGSAFISLMGTNYDPTNWHRSTHAASTSFLATDWVTDNAIYDADGLSLRLEHAPGRPGHFHGGEIQTRESYGFGRYEVLMRPASGSGTVSSFFTYTGPYFGHPHDEVDIEFLGENTRQIHLNYFRNGQVGEALTLDLPFDASEALHLYAFEWHPDAITWFVDGISVHQTRIGDGKIPQTAGSIIVNLWSGTQRMQSWHGRPDFTSAVEANYGCISFQPLGAHSRACSTIFPPEEPAAPRRTPLTLLEDGLEYLKRISARAERPDQTN